MNKQPKNERGLEDLIIDLCRIILVDGDTLSQADVTKYVKKLTDAEKSILKNSSFENMQRVRKVILTETTTYLMKYQKAGDSIMTSPFVFAEGVTGYSGYCLFFKNEYEKIHGAAFPPVLKRALLHIQDISDYFRVFTIFYDIRTQEVSESIVNEVDERVQKVAIGKAEEAASKITNQVVEKEVNSKIQEKMIEVSSKISETSVTILGIFAGIVLTVVAGLFYSSAVMESVNSTADIHKLVIIATVVGFVCINIIAAMFNYIIQIQNNGTGSRKEEQSDVNRFVYSQKGRLLNRKTRQKYRKYEKAENPILSFLKQHIFILFIDLILISIMIIAASKYEPNVSYQQNDTYVSGEVINGENEGNHGSLYHTVSSDN